MILTLPSLISSSSSSASLPRSMNQDNYFNQIYPNPAFLGYNGCPWSPSLYQHASLANYTKTITDHTTLETVWATPINAYFRTVVDAFQNIGNFYSALADVWSQAELQEWWAFTAVPTTWAYTFSDTVRIASIEKLKAWQTVGASFSFAPSFKLTWQAWSSTATTINCTNLVASAVVKLMNTSWTLTTIWTLASTAASTATSTWLTNSTQTLFAFAPVATTTFTPATSSLNDRIVIDLTFSWTLNTVAGASTTYNIFPYLWFGFIGSIRQLPTDYQAYRPFQVSIS